MQRVGQVARGVVNSSAVKSALGTVTMSKCAAKLASAIADPFSEEARDACFPLYPAPDSQKVCAFTRFDGAIGTAGVGFVAINPSVSNDSQSHYYTDSTFTGTSLSILTAASTVDTGVVRGYTANIPYSTDQFLNVSNVQEPSLYGRVVSVGLRITYTGTTLNQSGMCTLLQHPVHGTLTGATTANLQSFGEADICPFTRKPCTLIIAPAAVAETGYPTALEASSTRYIYPFGTDTRFSTTFGGPTTYVDTIVRGGVAFNAGAPIAAIMVTGVPGMTFHVDMVVHLEYTGPGAASASTPNSVDVSSVYAILTAASQLSTRKMAHPNESNWKLLMDGVRAAMGSPVALSATGVMRSLLR